MSIRGSAARRAVINRNTIDYSLHLINNQMSPLVNLTYDAQLSRKQKIVYGVLQLMGKKLRTLNPDITCDKHGLPCRLEEMKPSPLITGYRNKDEFSIWTDKDGKKKIVGFLTDSLARTETYCVEPDLTVITKDSHKTIAKHFQDYIRNVTPLDICRYFDRQEGNWRRLIVRSNREDQHMVICVLHPKVLTPHELLEEKQRLKDYFTPIADNLSIKSLFFQACRKQRCSNKEAPFQLLFGEKMLNDTMLGLQFKISPESFFQINPQGAEVLYENMINHLNLDQDTIVIDLHCGIGSPVLALASRVKKIYGIDSSSSAIDDAYRNADANGVTNFRFFHGPLMDLLPELLTKLERERKLIVIAKPNRGGLATSTLNLLREFEPVKQIAYLSCKPDSVDAVSNFVHLCRSFKPASEVLGGHFTPKVAIPVDLFPQTLHHELIMIFERSEYILF